MPGPAAHFEAGIVHQDIKPIYCVPDVVSDFL
jgi:hypothetical protein